MTEKIYDHSGELKECAEMWRKKLENLFQMIKEDKVTLSESTSGYGLPDDHSSIYGCMIDLGEVRIRFEGFFYRGDLERFVVEEKGKSHKFLGFEFHKYKKIVDFNSDYDRFPKEFKILTDICTEMFLYWEEKEKAKKRLGFLEQVRSAL